MAKYQYILKLSCLDRPGIVAAVSTYLFEKGGNICEAQQFDDVETGKFFARIAFDLDDSASIEALRAGFSEIAERLQLNYAITDPRTPRRVLLMVSKFDHCLADLLYRWRIGELPMTPTAIISNHRIENYAGLDFSGIPFHHLPISKDTKMEQEAQIWALVRETQVRSGGAGPLHAGALRCLGRKTLTAAASIFTIPSCPASKVRSPIIRRMGGALNSSVPRRIMSPRISMRGRSSNRMSSAFPMRICRRIWCAKGGTLSGGCSRAPCGTIWKTG